VAAANSPLHGCCRSLFGLHVAQNDNSEGNVVSLLLIGPAGIYEWKSSSPLGTDDPRWVKIKELSGLGDEALSEFNSFVGFYREELRVDASRDIDNELWKQAVAAKNALSLALQEVKQLNSNPAFFEVLRVGLDGQDMIPSESVDRIRQHRQEREKQIEKDIDWYENALKRMHHDERSGGWQSLLALVRLLNILLKKYTGHRVQQSFNHYQPGRRNYYHYVREACEFANRELSESAIREAVKQIVREESEEEEFETGFVRNKRTSKKKPRREQAWDIGNWHILLPGCEDRTKYVVENSELEITAEIEPDGSKVTYKRKNGQTYTTFLPAPILE